ncbi:MAG: bifunctional (p)ppGpp synthetase/guanosine-3',5'-bis(diphosphate) 3'-pyrophosphohydrolase [Gammaproteobacteria bacterium]|nr:bifunctional (p)ppGpp synthetase/guanosine-3',5'-bis(diphosphate) 3'-pyrophosphohydrolase [Gammaproteobacteria bacterium]
MVSVTTHFSANDPIDRQGIEAWLQAVAVQRSSEDIERLRRACEVGLQQQGEADGTGEESALKRAISVADTLFRLGLDVETMIAAILHNLLEAQEIDWEALSGSFGRGVGRMLRDLARIGSLSLINSREKPESLTRHTEYLRRMLLSIADDIRVVLVVLAERLYEMRGLKRQPVEVQRMVARETEDLYAPLANRLGIWQIKWELEDLCLRYLHNSEYMAIARKLDGKRADREAFIVAVMDKLKQEIAQLGINAEISGRPKHIYSIWKKMKRKGVDIDQIFDLRALRVLVDTVAECYTVLGVIHGTWRHIPGEFDDYIATPKANLYRSIHTAVIGPDERPVEIQIRTREMHEHAELGVAAHWRYKEAGKQDLDFERRISLMRNWLDLKDDATQFEDFVETLKSELEAKNIYVLTPHGRVVELPMGSTAVDFAYAIHTHIGHRCRGAKVDGRITPLTQPLESGKTVEILTVKEGGPSRDWLSPHLGYTHTSRARNRIRHWFKQQDYEQHLDSGRTLLDREIVRLGVARPDLEKAAARFNFKKTDDLIAAIGRGEVSPVQVAGMGEERKRPEVEVEPTTLPLRRRPGKPGVRGSGDVLVEGVLDLLTHTAGCCKPVPYDSITGFITRGRGVSVHRSDCATLNELGKQDRTRLVEVAWAEAPDEASYPVDIRVIAADRKGLLRDISSILANEEVNVVAVSTQSDRRTDQANMRFTVEVASMRQLSRILEKISQLPDVIDALRQR